MAIQCPDCLKVLDVPEPASRQLRCDQCQAVIQLSPPAAAPAIETAVSAGAPNPKPPVDTAMNNQPRRLALLFGILTGVLLLGCCPFLVLGTAWLFTATKSDPGAKETPPSVAVHPEPPLSDPPDPRIQIVQPAVDRGVAYIKSKVPAVVGMRGGYLGLNGLALLEGGVSGDDPDVHRLADAVRKQAPGMNQVYDLASCLFFLNRWDEIRPLSAADRSIARGFACRIIAGQHANGLWSYGGSLLSPENEAKMLTDLRNGIHKPAGGGPASMSNTQFAMLAVWGSRRHGVPVREPLLLLAKYFHANQRPDGHWNYPAHNLKATSTCAGLISLAIESALLNHKEFNIRPRNHEPSEKRADINKAFEFVSKTIGRKKEDPGAGRTLGYGGGYFDADAIGDLYFLWTLERVGVIYSKEVIHGKNWFDWGYPIVMGAQAPDGSWNEPHPVPFGPHIDTPFAILFLKRANIARDLTEMIRERAPR